MSITADPRIGTTIAGYRIERLLGRGGMSVVYLAYDPGLERKVALKLISPELSEDESFRERFRIEWRRAASIEHPNVVPIYDAAEADGQLYIAMRYIEGTDLKALLETEGALEPSRALNLLSQAAAGLDAAHDRRLVHRDVKPSNVLVSFDRDGEHAYLADFGLTKPASTPDEAQASIQLSGSTDYVSPEQIADGTAEAASDIYSLGALLYESLIGEVPYLRDGQLQVVFAHLNDPPPKPSVVEPELPEAIDGVIAKAMAKDPGDRYPSGAELAAAASAAFPEQRSRRWPIVALLGVVAAAAAVVAAILLAGGGGDGGGGFAPVQVDSVVRIDPVTNKAAAAIAVDRDPTDVAVGEGAVWVSSRGRGTISRIDPERNSVTRTDQANAGPATGVAVGEGAVWATYGAPGKPYSLQRLDPVTRTFSVMDAYGGGPWVSCCIAIGLGAVWMPAQNGQAIRRVDSQTNDVIAIPSLGSASFEGDWGGIAVGESGVWVFVGGLNRINRATNEMELITDFPFGTGGMAAGEGAVWVTDLRTDAVVRFDPVERRVTDTIKVGTDVTGIAVGERSVWVGNGSDGTVSRIDPETREVVATIEVGGSPERIAVGEGGVWVTVRPG